MSLYLFNSLSRKKEEFIPINPPSVGLYTCGPTVYNYAHIGNLRTHIFNDLLQRTLLYNGYSVKRVMNVTDVGHLTGDRDMGVDKMEKAAGEKKMDAWQLSNFYLEAFKNDMRRLNMLEPTVWEKATDTIAEQISLIKILEEKGFTYKTSDGVYFDTSKFPSYGQMSSLDKKGMQEAARVDFNPERKNPSDFALWKFNKTGLKRQMEWESPWGVGFPGWHIECSAISLKHLGAPFDIHTGAIDLKETHHPNEIAQTESATGKKMANFWLHAGFLNVAGAEKMSKSKGNFLTLQALIDKGFNPLAFRYYMYGIHWRKTAEFSWEALESAQRAYDKIVILATSPKAGSPESVFVIPAKAGIHNDRFLSHLNDDLNMPQVLAVIWEAMGDKGLSAEEKVGLLVEWDKVLGLLPEIQMSKLKSQKKLKYQNPKTPTSVLALIQEREEMRKNKEYKKADGIRDQLEALGHRVIDGRPIGIDKGKNL